jgi:GNAT superfamily N-acetyltransferase
MHIREATHADSAELVALQSRCPQGTSFSVTLVNSPHFFTRVDIHDEYRVYAACEDARIVGSIACVVRDALINARVARVGRVFQLFVDPAYRGMGLAGKLLAACEKYLQSRAASLAYAIIMQGNTPSMRCFEGQGYLLHRTLPMPGIVVYRDMDLPCSENVRQATVDDLPAIADLLNSTWGSVDFYEPADAAGLASLAQRVPGLAIDNIFLLTRDGQVRASLGFWEMGRVMRMTVKSLSFKMRAAGAMIGAMRLFGPAPSPPLPGDVLNQAALTHMGYEDSRDLAALLRHLNNHVHAMGIGQIFYACEKGSSLLGITRGFVHIDSAMHLYIRPLQTGLKPGSGPVHITGLDL